MHALWRLLPHLRGHFRRACRTLPVGHLIIGFVQQTHISWTARKCLIIPSRCPVERRTPREFLIRRLDAHKRLCINNARDIFIARTFFIYKMCLMRLTNHDRLSFIANYSGRTRSLLLFILNNCPVGSQRNGDERSEGIFAYDICIYFNCSI